MSCKWAGTRLGMGSNSAADRRSIGGAPVRLVQKQVSDAADTLTQASVSDQKQRLLVLGFQPSRVLHRFELPALDANTALHGGHEFARAHRLH